MSVFESRGPDSDSHDRESNDENPWVTLDRRTVYENPWIRVHEDRVIRPDGHPGIYGVVDFKNLAIGVLPVDEHGRIWLVGQYRYPLGQYSWEIPEGGGHDDESPEEAARRELREETGLIADHLEFLAEVHLSNSVCNERARIYRATGLQTGRNDPEGSERLQVRRVDWEEAWAMFRKGEITDSMTVIALLDEALRRERGGDGS